MFTFSLSELHRKGMLLKPTCVFTLTHAPRSVCGHCGSSVSVGIKTGQATARQRGSMLGWCSCSGGRSGPSGVSRKIQASLCNLLPVSVLTGTRGTRATSLVGSAFGSFRLPHRSIRSGIIFLEISVTFSTLRFCRNLTAVSAAGGSRVPPRTC